MNKNSPVLLNFSYLSNGKQALVSGQLAYSLINDFSFEKFSWRKNFRTIVNLYRAKSLTDREITLIFDHGTLQSRTGENGGFQIVRAEHPEESTLNGIELDTGEKVRLIHNLYDLSVNPIASKNVVVSDIDDTLLHSYIRSTIRKFRTLMFTAVEDRRVVEDMQSLMRRLKSSGAAMIYLSNSEENLYPLIRRFLQHNNFPDGPLILKQLRDLKDVLFNRKYPPGNKHKLSTLQTLLEILPDKDFTLVGDNTQQDPQIYLEIARKFPAQIRNVIIRNVKKGKESEPIKNMREELEHLNISMYYRNVFPTEFSI